MKLFPWLVLVASLYHAVEASRRKRHRTRSACTTAPRLQDKWHFVHHRRLVIKVKARHFVLKNGSAKAVKYKCMESSGNIYLLRKRNYRKIKRNGKKETLSGVLCLGFSYVADHPRGEYAVFRLIERGEGSQMTSPVILPKGTSVSINDTCDLTAQSRNSVQPSPAFIKRAPPGCKFPKELHGRWNYTYQHARSLEIWSRNSTLHLMDGRHVRFHCEKKDSGIYILRAKKFVNEHTDAIMCAEFTSMVDEDPFYKYKISRHSSGRVLDNQLRPVSTDKPVFVHVDCDWMGSPARPEFIYP